MRSEQNGTDLAIILALGFQFCVQTFSYLYRTVLIKWFDYSQLGEYLLFFLYSLSSIGVIVIATTLKHKGLRILAIAIASAMFLFSLAGNLPWVLNLS